ncbi:rho GTPase-activating protein 18 isoform X3 [Scyliorhinus torazame]|uniref:rho GTPase-activating protein 18 isoform X3 n=1 Tax=Scyliorhinus torazame TaxID=75743 RepID=UPI003B5CF3FD
MNKHVALTTRQQEKNCPLPIQGSGGASGCRLTSGGATRAPFAPGRSSNEAEPRTCTLHFCSPFLSLTPESLFLQLVLRRCKGGNSPVAAMESDQTTGVVSKTYSRIPRPKLYANSMPVSVRSYPGSKFAQRRESSPSIMNQMQSQHFQEQLSSDCSSSQDSLDNLSLDDFWTEVENIKESCGTESDENVDVKTVDDGEVEADWLQDAGLSTLIKEGSNDDDEVVLLSTLTRTQSAAVQRRVDNYTLSMRVKSKQPVRDVRDVFARPKFSEMQDNQSPVIDALQPDQQLEHLLPDACSDKCKTSLPTQCELSKTEFISFDISYSEQASILRNHALYIKSNKKRKDDGTLPQYRMRKNKLGVTRIGDLSANDMKKIHSLALIELTALFDVLNLEVKQCKAMKIKVNENKVFGVPLANLIENDQKIDPSTKVPLFLKELLCCLEIGGLETEGILRISGSVSRMKNLQQEIDANFYQMNFDWKKVHQNDLAGLLKMFIRELPSPLLTAEYVTAFTAVKHISDQTQMIHSLNLLVVVLPEIYRATLKLLLEFLRKVIDKEKKNKMNLWNVSTIIAPNLFMHKGILNKIPDGNQKQQAEKSANVVRMLIHYQDLLWTIPCFLVAQVRKLNDNSNKKSENRLKYLLKKIHTDKHDKPHVEQQLNKVIKIQAPQLLKDTMEVQLNSNITIGDVVAQFQKQLNCNNWDAATDDFTKRNNNSTDGSEFCLYEVGGNIGEHCLDPDTHMLELHRINPQAEWVIRPRAALSKDS